MKCHDAELFISRIALAPDEEAHLESVMRNSLIVVLLVLASETPGWGAYDWHNSGFLDRKTESLFQEKTFQYKTGQDEIADLSYRLYVPEGADARADQTWPLLVWLHGYGEAGSDNREHLRWMNLLLQERRFPGIIMAYQCPPERPTWSAGADDEQPMVIARAIVNELLASCPIDAQRIYVSGVSSGGTGCWDMLLRYPELFAAGAPLASGGSNRFEVSSIAHVPLWAFHAYKDPEASVDNVRATVKRLQAVGGNAWLTVTAGQTHDCWNAAFQEYHFVDWLLAQRQGEQVVPIPWWAPWKSFQSRYLQWDEVWPPLALVSVVAGLVWAVRRHLRVPHAGKNSPAENELH